MPRLSILPIFLVLLAAASFAQDRTVKQRLLVSPSEEIIPLRDGESAADRIRDVSMHRPGPTTLDGGCTDKLTFGYDPVNYQVNSNFGAYHEDVIAQWFEMPADGRIDTIFWYNFGVGATDSLVYVRVYSSVIGPDYGPGVRPGPFNPPCQYWGYWIDTNDPVHGVTPFPEEATDTAWVSTIMGSPVPTRPPFAELRWGGPYPFQIHANSVNFVAMDWLGDTIGVKTGERLFVTLEIPPCGQDSPECAAEERTEWAASYFHAGSAGDENYPSRNWKFYSHPTQPFGCYAPLEYPPGWIARGGDSPDTLAVGAFNIWYTMTVTSNVPPVISPGPALNPPYTFDTSAMDLAFELIDCNLVSPESAGVAGGVLELTVNGIPQAPIPFVNTGGDVWECTAPGFQPVSEVSYRIVAYDLVGDSSETRGEYVVAPYGSEWYGIVPDSCVLDNDISSTGQEINPSSFMDSTGLLVDGDNGVAGPIDMGREFTLFREEYRYAWISVNGAIALTHDPSPAPVIDTLGEPGTFWLAPCPYEGREHTCRSGQFIAPYWADHVLADGAVQYGRILYESDSCVFIVQWDSMGAMVEGTVHPDFTTFRVVINRCDGSVEFEYESVGSYGFEWSNITGMERDAETPFDPPAGELFYNKWGYPAETRLQNFSCTRFYPTINTLSLGGWTLAAVSGRPLDGNYSLEHLFPTSVSRAFYHDGYEYVPEDPLVRGRGYWMKFMEEGAVGRVPSVFTRCDTVPLHDGWNTIGGPSRCVHVAEAEFIGANQTSSFFSYGLSGWYTASELCPGTAYWVKVDGNGEMVICSGSESAPTAEHPTVPGPSDFSDPPDLKQMSSLTVKDASGRSQTLYIGNGTFVSHNGAFLELPPRPPSEVFDVRFVSGGMGSVAPGEGGVQASVPITVQGAAVPLTVSWDFKPDETGGVIGLHRTPLPGGQPIATLVGSGSVIIAGGDLSSLVLRRASEVGLPADFAIAQNFPNPFNPLTTIEYELPITTHVAIRMYDVLGKEVGVLVNEVKTAGRHSASWDGSGMPSGVYYCRMTAGSFSRERKLLLIR